MRDVLFGAAVLACPVGMGAMMWMMGRAMRKPSRDQAPIEPSVESLREEHRRLAEKIEAIDRQDRQPLPTG